MNEYSILLQNAQLLGFNLSRSASNKELNRSKESSISKEISQNGLKLAKMLKEDFYKILENTCRCCKNIIKDENSESVKIKNANSF